MVENLDECREHQAAIQPEKAPGDVADPGP
jgi:hypothetical protein